MKGQFFILGAVILCSLFFMAFPRSTTTSTFSKDFSYIYSNIVEGEFPLAFNYGLKKGSSVNNLLNFTRFSYDSLKSKYIDFSTIWIATEMNSDVKITVGNFLGSKTSIELNASGPLFEQNETLIVNQNSTNTVILNGVSNFYNLTVSFNNIEKQLFLERNKSALYVYSILERRDELLVKELIT